MRVAIDTNRYVDFARGVPAAVDVMQTAARVFIPFVVLGELRAGFLSGSRAAENEAGLSRLLHRPRVEVLFADELTTHHYSQLFRQLRKQGTPIPTNDLWIAALVIQHGLILFARDAHFDRIQQLSRV